MALSGWGALLPLLAALVPLSSAQTWVNLTTAPSGVLQSPNWFSGSGYPNNNKQRWTITTPGSSDTQKFLELELAGMDIEGYPNAACASSVGYDWLVVAPYSMLSQFKGICDYRNALLSGATVWCDGRKTPRSLFTNTNSILVEFCTDSIIARRGFELIWSTVGQAPATTTTMTPPPTLPPTPPKSCPLPNQQTSIQLQPGQTVNVTSPGFPRAYDNNVNCTWIITTTNSQMSWKSNFFDVEGYSSACVYDYLSLTHTESTGTTYSFKYCRSGPNGIHHHTQQLIIQFVTNPDIVRFGWSLSVSAPLPTTPKPTLPPQATPNNTDFDIISASYTGHLNSPFWPNPYGNNEYYKYKVNNPIFSQGYDVRFSFDHFHTEPDYDQLKAFTLEGYELSFDGDLTGKGRTISSEAIYLIFKTDNSVTHSGFSITISAVTRPFACPAGQFKCETANVCIDGAKRCDGNKDCADGTDETDNFCQMPSVCGTQSVQPNILTSSSQPQLIVNGTVAKPGTWPWTISMHIHSKTNPDFQTCGGSLIAPHWVITAAHCVYDDTEPADYFVKIGSWRDHQSDAPYQHNSELSAIYYNPMYNPHTFTHDIALLRLASPVPFPFNSHTNVPCLPAQGAPLPPVGTGCIISGWGVTEGTGSDTVLRQAIAPIFDTQLCNSTNHYHGEIDGTMVCAGYEGGGIDTCSGDSGGPLVCKVNGRWVLTGVTSWGFGCAVPHKPGVYSKVSALIGWVRDTINMHD